MKYEVKVPALAKTLFLSACIVSLLGGCQENKTSTTETTTQQGSTTQTTTNQTTTTQTITTTNSTDTKTNIIFIMLDDTGIRDLGCYDNDFNETPNIDALAESGVLFTDYYTQPLCSPSRSALLTGQNVVRTGIVDYIPHPTNIFLDTDEFLTFPQLLTDNGYRTGLLGKWHLSAGYDNYPDKAAGAPEYAGFDEVLMSERAFIGGGDYFYPYYHIPQATQQLENTYLVDHMNNEALDFIERNQDEPFFLMYSHYATHIHLDAPEDTVAYFQDKRGEPGSKTTQDRNPYLAAMLKHVDDGVGAIVKKLEELGIRENTMIIITSDNGGDENFTDNGEYRAGKGTIYEGGIRDPLIINWPGLTPSVSNTPVSIIDFYQTFAEVANIEKSIIPENAGLSLLPILNGEELPERDCLYWVFPRFGRLGGMAIRKGDYKYVESLETGKKELFNLKDDPSESNNIIDDNPEIYLELVTLLHEKLREDSVGKSVLNDFGDDEHYIWKSNGEIFKTGGKLIYTGDVDSASTMEGIVRHNFEASIDIKGYQNTKAGLIFRANYTTPLGGYFKGYAAILNFEENEIEIQVLNQDKAYVIASYDVTLNPEQTYKLKVVTEGSNIKVYLDDMQNPKIEYTDYSFIMGTVGVIGKNDIAEFDNLYVLGIENNDSYNHQQLNIKPNDTSVLTFNGNYLSFENSPFIENELAYFEINEILNRLNIQYEFSSNQITINKFDNELIIDLTNNIATLNNESITMPNIINRNGIDFIALEFIVSTLGFGIKVTEGETGYNYTIINEPTTIVYDTNSMIQYIGDWFVLPSDLGAFGDTTTRSKVADEEAVLSFYGVGVKLYLARGAGAGICDIYIDGEYVTTFDAYSSTPIVRSLAFEVYDLTKGYHEIKIVNTGLKSGTATNINIDGIEVITRHEGEGLPRLQAPEITLTDGILSYTEVNNATSYRLEIGLINISISSNDIDLSDIFLSHHFTSYTGNVYLYAVGDGENYNSSTRSNGVYYEYLTEYGSVLDIESRGTYTYVDGTLVQVEQSAYNSYPAYDKIVYKTPFGDFDFTTILRNNYLTPTVHSKFGVMITRSNSDYFNIFFLPESNTLYLLSTNDGGATWVRLWHKVECDIDLSQGVKLNVTRVSNTINIYVNDVLVFTEQNYLSSADVPLYIGFVSEAIEDVEYLNIEITGQKILNVPTVSLDGSTLDFYSENSTGYTVKIDNQEIIAVSPFNVYNYLNNNNMDSGRYSISVKAIGDGIVYSDSGYSEALLYEYTKPIAGADKLSTPTISVTDSILNYSVVDNASSYTIKIEDGQMYSYVSEISNDFDLFAFLSSEGFVSGDFYVSVKANGDQVSYIDSDYSIVSVFTINPPLVPIKGTYSTDGSNVTLDVTGGVLNADNYQTGYDKNYTAEFYADVIISATIKFDTNIPNKDFVKFGLALQEDSETFYYAFINAKNNVIYLLVRQNNVWVSLWSVQLSPTIDLIEGVNMTIEKTGTTVNLYVNSNLIHTLENFTPNPVQVGLVSEACQLVIYEDVSIQSIDDAV